MDNMEYLNDIYFSFCQERKLKDTDLKRIIFIYCHSQKQDEITVAKMILNRIGENTKIEVNTFDTEETYKNLINEYTRRLFKGAYMP